MPQETNLLAYLVPRLTSRVEDTATDALAFILNKSPDCRDALDLLLREGEGPYHLDALVRFDTQVTYEDGSRPDMVGYDQGGVKRLLVESKFWASLLEGQASSYFDQLEDVGPGVLLFIAPATRLEILWGEITRQMEGGPNGSRLEAIGTSKQTRRARVVGPDKQDRRLMLVSWTLLLDRLVVAVRTDSLVASDIQQLRGLARREDDEAFQPISKEELGPSLARRVQWLNRLVDDVVEGHGLRQGWMSVKSLSGGTLRATPQRNGYGRYFRFSGVTGYLFLCVDFGLWATSGDTPLWLRIDNEVPVSAARLRDSEPSVVETEDGWPYGVPLYLSPGVEYERVVAHVVCQLRAIWEMLNSQTT